MGPPGFSGDFFVFGVGVFVGPDVRVWDWLVDIKRRSAKFVGKSISCVESPIYSELRSI